MTKEAPMRSVPTMSRAAYFFVGRDREIDAAPMKHASAEKAHTDVSTAAIAFEPPQLSVT